MGVALGLVGTAVAASVAVLVAVFGVLEGGSTGMGYVVAVRAVGTVSNRHGLALGLVVSAYAAGTIAVAPAAALLLEHFGRVGTFMVLAAAAAVMLAAAALLLPARLSTPPPPVGRRGPVYTSATVRCGCGWSSAWAVHPVSRRSDMPASSPAEPGWRAGGGAAQRRQPDRSVGRRPPVGPDRQAIRPAREPGPSRRQLCGTRPRRPPAGRAHRLGGAGHPVRALSALILAATADAVPAARLGATYGAVFTGWGVAGLLAPLLTAWVTTHLGWHHAFLGFLAPATLRWLALALPLTSKR